MTIRALIATAVAIGAAAMAAPVAGQNANEAVMVAAGQWAKGQLPGGGLRLDPHRTGEEAGQGVAERVARALGAELGTLEATRICGDVMDPSTCRLQTPGLIAISAPDLNGDRARVRVHGWFRQSDPREPVGKASWQLELVREGGAWRVVSGGR